MRSAGIVLGMIVWIGWLVAPAWGADPLKRRPADRASFLDDQGVLRWSDDRSEVALFGVNLYLPFAIDYAQLKGRGVDIKAETDRNLAHLVRLGLDCIRLHCWDRELSDAQGNLLDNEHLELLDYLLAEAKQRGVYALLTPMAWWGTGNPSEGFSNHYTMHQMTTDPEARKAQETYLAQFVSHVNRYTGLAYQDDPAIVAFELINEPLYPQGTTDGQVTEYINALTEAVRGAGCRKPIFYNGWANRHHAVADSKADGCTFGWYPTGLVAGHELTDNYLPRVARYPGMDDPALRGKAVAVYEFDAADVPGGYMYPAMARAFRAGGAQIANQFQYDLLALADSNVNWQTHYLNLVYAPSKTVSFAIAAEAFRSLPRRQGYGDYSASNRFGACRVSYEELLSEYVSDEVYMYSNDTQTKPPRPERLERIAGWGSSPVVQYAGTGAYFLDRLATGLWRLEVYPDCVWVADPFSGGAREKSRVYWRERELTVRLPDLGDDFTAERAAGGPRKLKAREGRLTVAPGMYWCRPAGVTAAAPEGTVTTFVAPPSSEGPAVVWHDPARRWAEGRALPVEASVATAQEPDRVVLHFRMAGAGPFTERPLEQAGPYRFRGEVPAGQVKAGEAEYCLTVDAGGKRLLFPGGGPALAKLAELSRRPEVVLADFNDQARASRYEFRPAEGHKGAAEVGSGEGERSALRLTSEGFGEPPSCCAATVEATPLTGSLEGYNTLCLRARGGGYTSAVEVVAVQRDGRTYGANALLTPRWETAKLPFDRLAPMWQTRTGKLDPAQIKEVRLTFGAWLFGADRTREHMVEVSRVWLAAEAPVYTVPVERRGGPVTLFDPALEHVRVHCDVPFSSRLVRVPRTEDQALRAGVEKFGPAPSCLGFRVEVDESVNLWREEMEDYNTLVLRARGAEVATDRVEIVLIERDGAPWGTNVPLSGEWQEVAVPLKELRYWTNWGPKVPGRGGTEDHLRPEDVAAANVCFGAWLYPEHAEEPHTVEIGAVKLERR